MKHLKIGFILFLLLSTLFGCHKETSSSSKELIIYSPHPLEFIDMIVSEFEKDYKIKVSVVFAGTEELLSMIANPLSQTQADVLWGGALSTLLANQPLFESYMSKNEVYFLDEYKNIEGKFTRFSSVPSVIMVNRNLVNISSVTGYQDLLKEEFIGRIAYANPSVSSSSYEHLINQLYAMGNGNPIAGWPYMKQFVKQLNGQLLPGSIDVYRGVAEGKYAIGLTFEEAAARYVNEGAPIEIVYPVEGTIVKADGVGIVKGAHNIENAKLFIDFVTSFEIQRFISLQLNRRSIRSDVPVSNQLKSLEEIYQIYDDSNWSSSFKYEILEQFEILFEGN